MLAATTNTSPVSSSAVQFSNRAIDLMGRRGVSDGEQNTFAAILSRAATSNAGTNPKDFLNSLSANEMEVLRKVHCLADPISISRLDFEGAYNLLTAPGEAQDLDNDGFMNIGAAKMWQYPPPNAPALVKQAWEEATADIPESEKWLKMAPFLAVTATANLKADNSGFYEPGETGYRNIYAEPGFSYTRQVQDILSMMDRLKGQSSARLQEDKAFLQSFLQALTNHAVT